MSTCSYIGIRNTDGSVEAVYCHWDGYPEFTGRILREYYTAEEKVRKLISLGKMSQIGSRLEPIALTAEQVQELGVVDPATHSFKKPQQGVCIFYHRDKGDSWKDCKPEQFPSEEDARQDLGCKYVYIFIPDGNGSGTWETK